MSEVVAIIPARLASTRLPNKLLADVGGKTVIRRTYEQAIQSCASQVVVATDSDEIADEVRGFGGQVVMTADAPSGTDRILMAARALKLSDHIIVNVQGDEPFIPPVIIDQVAEQLQLHPLASMATLSKPFDSLADLSNPNFVKVVTDQQGFALYFSRSIIPYDATAHALQSHYTHHIGLYAYRRDFLEQYISWPQSELEKLEKLEQLRALHYGAKIYVATAKEKPATDINTESDLIKARACIKNQEITN